MIQSLTVCQDIHYDVSHCSLNQNLVQDFALPGIKTYIVSLKFGTQTIIYCWLKNVVKKVIKTINILVYHSTSGSVEKKTAVLQQ